MSTTVTLPNGVKLSLTPLDNSLVVRIHRTADTIQRLAVYPVAADVIRIRPETI